MDIHLVGDFLDGFMVELGYLIVFLGDFLSFFQLLNRRLLCNLLLISGLKLLRSVQFLDSE